MCLSLVTESARCGMCHRGERRAQGGEVRLLRGMGGKKGRGEFRASEEQRKGSERRGSAGPGRML